MLIVVPTLVGMVTGREDALLAEANATDGNAKPANAMRLTSCDSVRQPLKFNRVRLNSRPQSVAMPSERSVAKDKSLPGIRT